MARSSTNFSGWIYSIEPSQGTPGTTWFRIEPNSVDDFGATTETTSRNPISPDRQQREGSVTGQEAPLGFETDLILGHVTDFVEGFFFSSFVGPVGAVNTVSAVTGGTDVFGIPAIASAIPTGRLVYGRGFTNAGNNGIHVVTGGTTTTVIALGSTLVTETPPTNARLEVAGVEGATADIEIDASGNLITTVLDLTTLGLTVGQSIYLPAEANGGFANVANQGFARVTAIAANELTLDKKQQAFATDAGTGKQIRVFFGQFVRNVAATDASFLERYFQFEAEYDDLDSVGVNEYEYHIGCLANEVTFNMPSESLATTSWTFRGQTSEAITTTRKSGASTAQAPVKDKAFSTALSSELVRLRLQEVDETGLSTDFTDISVSINNNLTDEKVLGTLGAKYINTGNFVVTIDSTVVFTNAKLVNFVNSNTTVTFDFALKNGDGAVLVDIPSVKLGDSSRDLALNESIKLTLSGEAFKDATLGYSAGMSIFPVTP